MSLLVLGQQPNGQTISWREKDLRQTRPQAQLGYLLSKVLITFGLKRQIVSFLLNGYSFSNRRPVHGRLCNSFTCHFNKFILICTSDNVLLRPCRLQKTQNENTVPSFLGLWLGTLTDNPISVMSGAVLQIQTAPSKKAQ